LLFRDLAKTMPVERKKQEYMKTEEEQKNMWGIDPMNKPTRNVRYISFCWPDFLQCGRHNIIIYCSQSLSSSKNSV
jgi:hypothetical protein